MSLLPPNSTAIERAIEATIRARLDALSVPLRALWSVNACPAALLPHLAWALAVDEWDSRWGDDTRRAIIASAIPVARRRGTVASIRAVLTASGYSDALITEGRYDWIVGDPLITVGQPSLVIGSPGSWAVYTVRIGRPIDAAQAALLERLLTKTAPARCHLTSLLHQNAPWVVGDGSIIGQDGLTVYN